MTSVEDVSAAVASLTSEMAAMHVENQQKPNMLDKIKMKVGALASAQDLQAVIDAQAVLNNTHDQKLLAQGCNYFNLNQKADRYRRQTRPAGKERCWTVVQRRRQRRLATHKAERHGAL